MTPDKKVTASEQRWCIYSSLFFTGQSHLYADWWSRVARISWRGGEKIQPKTLKHTVTFKSYLKGPRKKFQSKVSHFKFHKRVSQYTERVATHLLKKAAKTVQGDIIYFTKDFAQKFASVSRRYVSHQNMLRYLALQDSYSSKHNSKQTPKGTIHLSVQTVISFLCASQCFQKLN